MLLYHIGAHTLISDKLTTRIQSIYQLFLSFKVNNKNMSNLFISSALRDIVAGCPTPPPAELVSYANSTYQATKMNMPLNAMEEAARYHLCCFAVVEMFQEKYGLADPAMNKIPIPTRRVNALLPSVRQTLNRILDASTPQATLQTKRIIDRIQTPTSYATESYIDGIRNSKLQAIDSTKRSLEAKLLAESTIHSAGMQSPPVTPTKRKQSMVMSPSKAKMKVKTIITTPILVAFCNQFYIPEHITMRIIQTYKMYRHVVGNAWGLLVGLVGISYLKLNKMQVKMRIGLRARLVENLHNLQHGGLTLNEVKVYLREVTRMIASQKWIKDAKFVDDESHIDSADLDAADLDRSLTSLTTYIEPQVGYFTAIDSPHVTKWVKRIRRMV